MNDQAIIAISCGFEHTLILKKGGDLFGFGNNERGQLCSKNPICPPHLIFNDPKIKILMGSSTLFLEWSPSNHFQFSCFFSNSVLTFLLSLKRIKNLIKIPRFVVFHIIQFFAKLY